MRRLRQLAALLLIFGLLAAALTPAQAQRATGRQSLQPSQSAMRNFSYLSKSRSLRWSADVIRNYAAQDDPAIVPGLLEAYRSPGKYSARNVQYLIANALRERYGVPGPDLRDNRFPGGGIVRQPWLRPAFTLSKRETKLLKRFFKKDCARDSNLWAAYSIAAIFEKQHTQRLDTLLIGAAGAKGTPALKRAAIFEAMSLGRNRKLWPVLEALSPEDYGTSIDDAIELEAWIWAVARLSRGLSKPSKPVPEPQRSTLLRIAKLVDNEKRAPRTRREARLALQFALGAKQPYRYAITWQTLIKSGKAPRDDGHSVVRFMGIEALGERILFLIDASDSMLRPLTDLERKSLTDAAPGASDDKGYKIDWDKVVSRFDAAREHVKRTVSRLDKKRRVAVLLFGGSVKLLSTTPSFVKASRGNVRKILRALDAFGAGRTAVKGTGLLGQTNYYGAMLAAFRLGARGMVDAGEHYDKQLLRQGADTIFFLSDGFPIIDGLGGTGPDIEQEITSSSRHDTKQSGPGRWVDIPARPAVPAQPEQTIITYTRDPETGKETRHEYTIPARPAIPACRGYRYWLKYRTTTIVRRGAIYANGPYAGAPRQLRDFILEVQRMNLVRRCLIHCVGIGEANPAWLEPIARIGRGKTAYFGAQRNADKRRGIPDLPESRPGD